MGWDVMHLCLGISGQLGPPGKMGPKGEPGEYVRPEVSSSFFALSLPLLGCRSGIGYDFSPAEGVEGWEEWGELEGPGHPPLWWLMGIPLEVLRPQEPTLIFPWGRRFSEPAPGPGE